MRLFIHWIFIAFFLFAGNQIAAQKLVPIPYVSGINLPIDLKHCGDNRVFVADRAGRIRIIDADGTLRTVPFLNITTKISSSGGEEGFLGMAFSPDYKTSGKFYVDYTSIIGGQLTTVVEEYRVSATDSNVADVSSALTILKQLQPFSNHNGGNLMFGKDSFLYINFGDGGSGGDPFGNGQNKKIFLGKILRIDISNSTINQPYVVPPSNPFYNDTTEGIKKEIWAYGVRNPWRSSVDRITGDLWIADVGQGAHEEIDYQAANDVGGRNYGWNIAEGSYCYNPSSGCNTQGLTSPVYDYSHAFGIAVTGGYVYRSAQSKSLFGMYLFSDFGYKWIDGIRQSDGALSGDVTHLITAAQVPGNPVSFGEDRFGDQYILFNGNNTVFKLVDTSYLRRPKAYFTPILQGNGVFLLQALQGKDLAYQWLKDSTIIPGATSADYSTTVVGNYTLEVTNTLHLKDTSDVFLLGSSINLISFDARKISGSAIQMDWKTVMEQNVPGYNIQKRQNTESEFSNIGFAPSKSFNSFSNRELDYSFTDFSALSYTKVFYRLQIQHTDGSFTYSDVHIFTSGDVKNNYSISPNPAKSRMQIYVYDYSTPLAMVIYDNTGKKVKTAALDQQRTNIDLPVSKGVYVVQVSSRDGSNKVRQKLVVL
ncbi:MAG: PQQ-dependent sugar dehydrogenase [Ginsengibacter sp.]